MLDSLDYIVIFRVKETLKYLLVHCLFFCLLSRGKLSFYKGSQKRNRLKNREITSSLCMEKKVTACKLFELCCYFVSVSSHPPFSHHSKSFSLRKITRRLKVPNHEIQGAQHLSLLLYRVLKCDVTKN